ncbi:FecCD family ABC transporter permease [Clostridium uliginosum]|uniref:Iron complex transport system permease protein n=1 Tax=Clostridium uliginosum TaxID=119641 RepID=A0A1I1PU78_9CLOT|nr:iron ABC transporter permease [Clostridium uliginosum]SFD13315.1 iron complex transport system permease protein [Clostridium uliginosum]
MKNIKSKSKSKVFSLIIGLVILLIFTIIIAVSLGSVKLDLRVVYNVISHKILGFSLDPSIKASAVDIVWQIRLPRVLLGVVTGVGLALGGVVMQATVENPLADPYILGISSGGTLGATFILLIGSRFIHIASRFTTVSFFAFLGALLASILVFKLSSIGGRITPVKLVLSGMIVNLVCLAFSNLMIYLTNDDSAVRSASEWTMGSLTSAKWSNLLIPTAVVFIMIIFFLTQCRVMNTMLLGDEAAITLGVDLHKYRRVYLITSAILTGIIVSSCGLIGFIGLVIPHITRSLVGTDHRINLPVAMLIGGIFLTSTDILARIVLNNMEMPIGIITSVIGAPFFIYIMLKRAYSFGER